MTQMMIDFLLCFMVSSAPSRGIRLPQELQLLGDSCSQMLQREEAATYLESLRQDSEDVGGGQQLRPVVFGKPQGWVRMWEGPQQQTQAEENKVWYDWPPGDSEVWVRHQTPSGAQKVHHGAESKWNYLRRELEHDWQPVVHRCWWWNRDRQQGRWENYGGENLEKARKGEVFLSSRPKPPHFSQTSERERELGCRGLPKLGSYSFLILNFHYFIYRLTPPAEKWFL